MVKQFLDLYASAQEAINAAAPAHLNSLRAAAYERLRTQSFATKNDEAYLYCPLFESDAPEWGYNAKRFTFGLNQADLFHCAVPGFQTNTVYVAGDVWINSDEELSLGQGAFVCSMRRAAEAHADILDKYFNKALCKSNDSFVSLNALLAQDGLLVYVPANSSVELPLQVVTMLRAGLDLNANARNLIVAEANSKITVIDCAHTTDANNYFCTAVTELFAMRDAEVNYYQMESTSSSTRVLRRMQVQASEGAKCNLCYFTLHTGKTRNHVEIDLNGEGADVNLAGMLLIDEEQQCENYTVIRHHASHCSSNELYKYILDDRAVAGFSGRVVVDHGAQHTDSYQTSRNISLSPTAKVLGRPQLEIYADDVKCGHGATTGRLDEAALFYMQQRGISKSEARTLLLQAFCHDVVEKVDVAPLADRLRLLIEKRLRGDRMQCLTCKMK